MKLLFITLLLLNPVFAQENFSEYDGPFPVVTPSDKYEKQAQQERVKNEKAGMEIRKNMRKASGLRRGDPRLRGDEPYDQAGKIMRPD